MSDNSAVSAQRERRQQHLIETDELAARIQAGDPLLRIVDLRGYVRTQTQEDGYQTATYTGAPEEYAAGLMPGAVYLDWSNDLSEKERPLAFKVASAERLKRVMEAIGVGDDTLLVGYDDEGGHFVSRVWLVLAAQGHGGQVRIVEGGIVKWRAEGRPLSTEPSAPRRALAPHDALELIASVL